MPGLLDFLNSDDAKLGIGLLAAAGPSALPMSFGQRLQGAMQTMDADKMNKVKAQLLQSQADEQKAQAEARLAALADQRLAAQTAQQFYKEGRPAMGGLDGPLPPMFQTGATPLPAQAPSFDMQGYAQARMRQNPAEGLKLMAELNKETPFGKVDPEKFTQESVAKFAQTKNYGDLVPVRKLEANEGVVWNPYDSKMAGRTLPNPNKPFQLGANGEILPNTAYQNYEFTKADRGAARTNVSFNTERSLLNDIAGGLGKSITSGRDNAQSALGTISTVNRLYDALDTGKVMAGPGTKFRQFGLQVGNVLGVTGKDAQERMLNTRQAIQSLAQLELDGAQQMKGQGQITEAERAIIKRAASGDVDEMTASELRMLGGILDRTARFKIRSYNNQVKPLTSNPNAAPLAPFLNVEEPPERAKPSVLRFDANGNPAR